MSYVTSDLGPSFFGPVIPEHPDRDHEWKVIGGGAHHDANGKMSGRVLVLRCRFCPAMVQRQLPDESRESEDI